MAAVLYWRLPALTPTNPGPLPWLPGIPETLHADPVWEPYLAKRSQVQDHACQGDAEPIWTPSGSHPSTPLIGEIAVWRAANGINPKIRDQPEEPQLETLPALWEQRPDRHIARFTSSGNETFNERQSAHTAFRPWHDDSQRPYQKPERRPSGAVRARPTAHRSRQIATLGT